MSWTQPQQVKIVSFFPQILKIIHFESPLGMQEDIGQICITDKNLEICDRSQQHKFFLHCKCRCDPLHKRCHVSFSDSVLSLKIWILSCNPGFKADSPCRVFMSSFSHFTSISIKDKQHWQLRLYCGNSTCVIRVSDTNNSGGEGKVEYIGLYVHGRDHSSLNIRKQTQSSATYRLSASLKSAFCRHFLKD